MVMINVVLAVIQFSFGQLRQHERMQDDEAQRRVAEEWALHHSTPCPGSVEMAAALFFFNGVYDSTAFGCGVYRTALTAS